METPTEKASWFNMNLIGLVLIVGSFVVSLGMVITRSAGSRGPVANTDETRKVITIMHWQLEPGYREALQSVIDEYNQLPHVMAANVEVRQLDVTERVYGQILNVHAVSGTAPDLCERGMTSLVQGSGVALFFDALGDIAEKPNPYNTKEYLPERLSDEEVQEMTNLPWGETFIDGMLSGWLPELQDYYSAPTSFVGSVRLYYNEKLFAEAIQELQAASHASPRPAWYEALFLKTGPDGQETGYVQDTPEVQAWIDSGETPETLGRTLMLCQAIHKLARDRGDSQLVPIAGSSYTDRMFAQKYLVPFTAAYATELNRDHDKTVSSLETWAGWEKGMWSFQDERLLAYFDCIRELCRHFPAGFLGLDREQARRRFVTGNAGMIATGLWDAKSLYIASEGEPVTEDSPALPGEPVTEFEGRKVKNHRFGVSTMPFPIPGPGERWSQYTPYDTNSATANGAGNYMVYQRSPNKKWAIDFLHFMTCLRINERLNSESGWLPIIVKAKMAAQSADFAPDPKGLSPNGHINFFSAEANQIASRYGGELKSYLSGDITYEQLVQVMQVAITDGRTGYRRAAYDYWQKERDRVRSLESMINVQAARSLLLDRKDAPQKIQRGVMQSGKLHNAVETRFFWKEDHPDEPFPEF